MSGAGMVHPNMLKRVGLDPAKYSGFAWGMGLDRIAMARYNINDIRALYNGDLIYRVWGYILSDMERVRKMHCKFIRIVKANFLGWELSKLNF